jgi:hypothetical protein
MWPKPACRGGDSDKMAYTAFITDHRDDSDSDDGVYPMKNQLEVLLETPESS